MYSGSTFNAYSGYLLGAHQKIDRVARKHLERLLPQCSFPASKSILQFEGNNGPDGIKRKSPAQHEPWHFMEPYNPKDTKLIKSVESHYARLVQALKAMDNVRAAFEAAWLAHAVVDGLTPAHHFPYEEKLVELGNTGGNKGRTSVARKLIMPGETVGRAVRNNWLMWGPKGLFTNHAAFEMGVAMIIAPLKIEAALPTEVDIREFTNQPLSRWFRQNAQDIADLKLYDAFSAKGWTTSLGRRVRKQLVPSLVQAVTLVWYGAAREAGLQETKPA